ncbi:two-partner secretion domain-containing protein [Mangrovitalea sediminis]|uniref:two-partner secretion domain-containing protein n=1 Tax=Mangrovitalea sediminis TaxID=1982043 RepID=UPI000BE536EB|nr:filamentous hemagglutinin N-terminal domain-containing protein [Mangrovitalea sediminis]
MNLPLRDRPIPLRFNRPWSLKLLALMVGIELSSVVSASPQGAAVQAGQVAVTTPAPGLTAVQQTTHAAILNWQSFNVGTSESVNFAMPDGSSSILNRVTGTGASSILGHISANGRVFLINPNGIVIGQGAEINTRGFLASTRDISNEAFLKGGPLDFLGSSTASIVNYGTIEAADGNVMLIGHQVLNEGTISAPNGSVGLAAGNDVLYVPDQPHPILIRSGIKVGNGETGVDNQGVIRAAQAELRAAGGDVYAVAVNQSGVIRADAVNNIGGRIVLGSDGGNIQVSGSLGAHKGSNGGDIFIGGSVHGNSDANIPNAAYTLISPSATIDASATGSDGNGGQVAVWSDQGTTFLGSLTARGGTANGGFAEVSGGVLDFRPATINLNASGGNAGTLLLDPGNLTITSSGADTNITTTSPSSGSATYLRTSSNTLLDSTLNTATIEALLNAGTNVQVTAHNQLTVNSDITWGSAQYLMLAATTIAVNGSITGGTGSKLVLYDDAGITQGDASTIRVDNLEAMSAVSSDNANEIFNGKLQVGTLNLYGSGVNSISAVNPANQIGKVWLHDDPVTGSVEIVDSADGLEVALNQANTTSPLLSFRTVGDLILDAGSSLSFATSPPPSSARTKPCGGCRELVLATSDGAVINKTLSSSAFTFGPYTTLLGHLYSNFRIYATDYHRTQAGGLSGGESLFNYSYQSAPAGKLDPLNNYYIFSGANPNAASTTSPTTGNDDPFVTRPTTTTITVNLKLKPKPVKIPTHTDSIVISYAPTQEKATPDDLKAAFHGVPSQTIKDHVQAVLKAWPADKPIDAATKQYLGKIQTGAITLDQVIQDARNGNATAQTYVMSIMPQLIDLLSQQDPSTLTNNQRLLLAKVAGRVNANRQRQLQILQQRLAAYKKRQKSETRGMTALFAENYFPDIYTEARQQFISEQTAVIGGVAALTGTGAGSAAAAAVIANAATIFVHASGAGGGALAVDTTIEAATAASGPVGIVIGSAVLLTTMAVSAEIESGNNKAAYDDFVSLNSKSISNPHELVSKGGGSQTQRSELSMASLEVAAEMFGN